MSIYLRAGAKVNLLLRVLGRDSGGYHNLRSLVAFSDFSDELWVEVCDGNNDEIVWQVGSSIIGAVAEDNILLRVLVRVRDYISLPYFRIEILKRIPMGGGLGGGSADAAALLNYLVSDYGLGVDLARQIGGELGSDIIVCMGGRACWLGGRGDDIVELDNFPKVYCLLVSCGEGLSTGAVFDNFGGVYSDDLGLVDGFGRYGDLLNYLQRLGGNDLWSVAVDLCSSLEVMRDLMVDLVGVDYVGMSGSGSVMFGLFWDYDACVRACDVMVGGGYFAVVSELS